MELRPSKPAFQSVVDLGLRDVGVRNQPRRLAAYLGKVSIPLAMAFVLFVLAACAVVRWTGAGWLVVAFAVAWPAAVIAAGLRAGRRSPVVVVRVNAEGSNQAAWLLLAPFLALVAASAMVEVVLAIPALILTVIMALLVWRGRGRLPEVLRRLRPLLAADEPVLGDGMGVAQGARRQEALRLVVATDRRVLVVGSARSTQPFVLLDVPYSRVSGFGIEWRYRGRAGVLSLTVAGADGAPPETHVVASMVPASLLSIATALHAHGVHTDDPAAVADAERAWHETLRREEPRTRLLDRTAMSTREFDRGLWLLLGLAAVAFYLNPLGVGLVSSSETPVPLMLIVAAVCGICGYVSATRSSLTYAAPLGLLVAPAFFFADTGEVIGAMLLVSAVGVAGLWAGWRLCQAVRGPEAAAAASPRRRAARGGLRYALSARRLIRISSVLLGLVMGLAATAGAAGVELVTLKLAIDEATAERLPVDGRSNLNGGAASLAYTPHPDLREFVTDEDWDAGPDDGARWELRSSFTKGYNVVSLAHYIFEPHLGNAATVADFVADKDREHSRLAGFRVTHTERVVDGRKGYVWNHGSRRGFWYYAAWFPQPVHTVRVECIARRQEAPFRRLCAEAIGSLEFHE